jgi:tetratricopeptide (TPR) repeat protein
MQAGDMEAAIGHLTALTDHAPDFAEGWNARATAYFQAGEYGPSIEDIGRTLTLNPRHFGALSGLGMIFEQLGDEERALEAYKAALAIHPQMEGIKDTVERLETEAAGQEL